MKHEWHDRCHYTQCSTTHRRDMTLYVISEVPTRGMMQEMLDKCLPGISPAVRRTRTQILIPCTCSMTGQAVLLSRTNCAGKSTVARFLGLFKRVAPLNEVEAPGFCRM